MKAKGISGKSRETKIVAFRLKNETYNKIAKMCGGKKRLNGYLKRRAEDLIN